MIAATRIIRSAPGPFDAEVSLDHDSRLLRRRKLATTAGEVLVDLAKTTSLEDGDALELSDGSRILVRAKAEPVMVVRGNLARLAWHIGNRHTPCRIEPDCLILREDHVLEAMLRRLGAEIGHADMPFCPEGGAYGHGRTFGHAHDPSPRSPHDHDHHHHA